MHLVVYTISAFASHSFRASLQVPAKAIALALLDSKRKGSDSFVDFNRSKGLVRRIKVTQIWGAKA